jgi:WXG100 family type VII secretion target
MANYNHITVDHTQLEQISGQLKQGASNIESQLNTLGRQVAPLRDQWKGQAQAEYMMYWEKWQRASADLKDALMHLSTLTHNAAQAFHTSDSNIASTFRR